MKKLGVCTALCLLLFPGLSHAADPSAPPSPVVSGGSFFVGLGGSAGSVGFNQQLYASGVSNIYSGTTLVAYGAAGGPADPFQNDQFIMAPQVQVGYFDRLGDSKWMWGVKFQYQYLGASATDQGVLSPQSGSFTNTGAAPSATSFTGNVVIRSSQTHIDHELALIPFVAHPFMNGFAYLGGGPVLFGTQSTLYGATGYADINGTHVDITGTADNFSSTNWMWGGVGQIGMTYFLDRTWFLDLNYTFAMTGPYTTNYSAPFASASDGYNDTGTLYANTSQRVTAQAVALSINKAF